MESNQVSAISSVRERKLFLKSPVSSRLAKINANRCKRIEYTTKKSFPLHIRLHLQWELAVVFFFLYFFLNIILSKTECRVE